MVKASIQNYNQICLQCYENSFAMYEYCCCLFLFRIQHFHAGILWLRFELAMGQKGKNPIDEHAPLNQ